MSFCTEPEQTPRTFDPFVENCITILHSCHNTSKQFPPQLSKKTSGGNGSARSVTEPSERRHNVKARRAGKSEQSEHILSAAIPDEGGNGEEAQKRAAESRASGPRYLGVAQHREKPLQQPHIGAMRRLARYIPTLSVGRAILGGAVVPLLPLLPPLPLLPKL